MHQQLIVSLSSCLSTARVVGISISNVSPARSVSADWHVEGRINAPIGSGRYSVQIPAPPFMFPGPAPHKGGLPVGIEQN